jgi:hypothetical protein
MKDTKKAVPEYAGAVMSQPELIRRSRGAGASGFCSAVAQLSVGASELIADFGDCWTYWKFHGVARHTRGLANRDYG